MAYMRLGDLLLSSGMISHEQLERALELQKESKERLGDVLVQSGIITEKQLIEALKIQLGVEFVDLTAVSIPVELAKYVPRTLAKKYCVVPVKLVRDTLYLAMSDPLDFIAQEEVKAASRKRVIPMIATHRATEQAISRLYGSEGTARVIEEMKREAGAAGPDIVPAQLVKDSDSSEGAPTIRFVNSLIERAFAERASDIHLEPQEGEMVVRMRIDGLLRRVLTVPAELQSTVISRLKIMGGMDIAERKVPQDGHAMLRVKGSEIDLRISSMPTVYGEKIVLRLLNKTSQLLSRDAIGLEGDDLESYQALLRNTGGVILLVGPTGSGKSTTMCVMLRDLAREEVNIVTLEDPVEYYIPGVSQCQINEKTGMTFAGGLRAILRQDPDIISVGEIRDGETASIAMRAAITGHLVLSTLHTNDAPSAVDRLRDVGVEPWLISGELPGVTKALMAVSGFFNRWWWLLLIGAALVIAYLAFKRTERGKLVLASYAIERAPLRRLRSMSAAGRFANTASKAGVECFPQMLTDRVGVGERAGSLPQTLDVIGNYFDSEVETQSTRLLSVLEPVITIVLAVIVVVLLLAVYLPMFSMYGSI